MTRIASFNVNSIKARMPNLLAWLDGFRPEVALLQEIKSTADSFPHMELEAAGYNVAISGQKSYNGVAILSTAPIEVERTCLPGDDGDSQARYIEGIVQTDAGVLRVASIYLPNGNPVDTDKFAYKLAWMERLLDHARALLAFEEPVVLGGDYNVIPQDEDCHDPAAWRGDALFRPESRALFRRLLALGYTEAFRTLNPQSRDFTFWDYQGGAWQNDRGIRIDHLLLSPQAADLLRDCRIDPKPRGRPKASDHTPIWCELAAA